MDFLHVCSVKPIPQVTADLRENDIGKNRAVWLVTAPFFGIALDIVVPLPSSLFHSLFLAILGSGLASMIWYTSKQSTKRSARYFFFNFKNYFISPLLYRKYNTSNRNSILIPWLFALGLSISIQVFFFTGGNSQFLANQISSQIEKGSDADLEVTCPKFQAYFYNEEIECRVKTEILGITVPARATLSIVTGIPSVKVSLL